MTRLETRRGFLKTSAASSLALASGGMLAACGGGSSAAPSGAKPAQLNMLYATVEAASDAVKPMLPKFKAATGVTLNMDSMPFAALQPKVFSELAARSPRYDIVIVDASFYPALAGRLEPLSGYIGNAKLNDVAEIDLGDFIPKVFYDTVVYDVKDKQKHYPSSDEKPDAAAIKGNGFDIYGLPIQANALTMSYRKDLFEDPKEQAAYRKQFGKDLAVPETWDDFVQVAKFFTRPDEKLWGTTLMAGVGDWSTDDFKTLLAAWGGDGHLVSDDGSVAFNTPEGVQALQFYADLINKHKVTPRGTTAASWDTVTSTFGSGLTAMGFNYHNMALNKGSKGEVAYALAPKNKGYGPHFGTWALGVNAAGKNKEWAYRAASWLTSAKSQQEMVHGHLHPTRTSVYENAAADPKVKEESANFYDVLGKSLAVGVGRARLTNYFDVSNIVAVGVNKAATGRATPEAALKQAAADAQAAMKRGS
jgi:multiple sugar transport system substrate-binding protein